MDCNNHNYHTVHNLIIIGAGCAGLTCALYAARSELMPLLFSGSLENKGGLLTKTSIVENFPGFPNGIIGFDLIQNMEQQAIKYGTTIVDSEITKLEMAKNNIFILYDSVGKKYYTHTVVIATGSTPNKLNLLNEDKYWGHGISSCAVCDGALYKNKQIMVIGGGDSALEEALFLTKFSKVTLVHRRQEFRASKIMQNRVFSNPNINVIYNTVVSEIMGSETDLNFVVLENVITHEKTKMQVDGLFYGLGLQPNTLMFKKLMLMDLDGYILRAIGTNYIYETMTSVPGIFVVGDASDKHYRQAVVAAGDGCKGAMDVFNYLNNFKNIE